MTRETRINLIFVGVFVALIAPGAVILVQKKLKPGAARMDMPDPVRHRLPYMAPQEVPGGVVRFIPEQTGQWVRAEVRHHAGGGDMLLMAREPVTSPDRTVQVAVIEPRADGAKVHLIAWDGAADAAAKPFAVTLDRDGKPVPVSIDSVETLAVPDLVRKELVQAGYVKPPAQVVWVTVSVTGDATGRLTLQRAGGAATSVNISTR